MDDLRFSVVRQHDRYVLVARRYGVVVRSNDLATGFRELEERVQLVAQQFSEAGVPLPDPSDEQPRSQAGPRYTGDSSWSRSLPFIIKSCIAIIVVGVFLSAQAILFSRFYGGSRLRLAIEHPGAFVFYLADRADQIPPEDMARLQDAIRRIGVKIGPLVREIGATVNSDRSEPAAQPSGTIQPSPPAQER